MSNYDNTNRGTLGRNKRKEKDSHPDFRGSINVEGVDFWLSGWVKESNGRKFFSLSVKRKEEAPGPAKKAREQAELERISQGDEEIPF